MLWEHLTLVRIQAGPPNSMKVRFIGKTQSLSMPMGGADELVHTRFQPRDLIFMVLKC